MGNVLRVDDVVIGKRYRKNPGDLNDLLESIRVRGLINPITIRRNQNLLLAGGRRFECLKMLGIEELIEGEHFRYFDDLENPVAVEFDENVIRKDFLPSEKVEIAMALEELAAERQESKKEPGEGEEFSDSLESEEDDESRDYSEGSEEEFPEEETPSTPAPVHQTSEKVARAVGWTGKTLRKAKEVYAAAKENPEKFGNLVQEMDTTGSVDGIHQRLALMKTVEDRKKYDLCDEVILMNTSEGLEIPKFLLKALALIPKSRQKWFVNEYRENLYRVKQTDFDRSIKSYSKGGGILALSENDLVTALTDVFEHTKGLYEEWPFITHARNITYQLTQALSSRNSRVTTLDKLELIMISMASLLALGHPVFKKAISEKLFDKLPIETAEAYESLLASLERLYGEDGRASLPVALVKKEEFEKAGWTGPGSVCAGIDKERSDANAFTSHEVIEDRVDEFSAAREVLNRILSGKAREYRSRVQSGAAGVDVEEQQTEAASA